MIRAIVMWVVVPALCACDGTPSTGDEPSAAPVALVSASPIAPSAVLEPRQADAVAAAPAASPGPKLASQFSYDLWIAPVKGTYEYVDTVFPVRGVGYETLHVFVRLRNYPRHSSPVAGVRPHCATRVQCDYLPAKRAGVPEQFTISLNDGAVAQLTSVNDMIAISVREPDLERAVTVSVTLTVAGQAPVTRRITYAPRDATAAPGSAASPLRAPPNSPGSPPPSG